MSIDFKIQNTCDHRINWESVRLSTADYKSIYTNYAIGSASSVKVRINGTELDSADFDVVTRKDPLQADQVQKYIMLNNKNKTYRPLVEINYICDRLYCPKCLGGSTLDDFKYGEDGDIATVAKELQLIQTVEKYIVTKISSNPFHSWMGTDIHGLLGGKIFDFDALTLEVRNQITLAINKLKKIQSILISSGRIVENGEIFEDLISVEVNIDETDATTVHALVTFTSRAGNTLQYDQLLEFGQLRQRIAY